jgi:asparagine synthase (glutamine-hydrolysing)
MCGIAGAIGPVAECIVERMLGGLVHRGPDGGGVARGGVSVLGATRLSIRGGAAGDQPLRTGRGLLVFNGEIYNSAELVKDLAWHGVVVDGSSDTAIVAGLLDVYGLSAVDRLNGMYALAWDDGERVSLARDPAGIKPLYYRAGAFASEIRPLLPEGGARPCDAAISRWLSFHVAYGEETFFEGVRRVPPGGILDLGSGRLLRSADAALTFASPNPALTAERIGRILERAVRSASPAERHGVALSGGLDSTLVAALGEGERVAYHGRVDADGCDESPYARAAAAELGLELIEVPIEPEAALAALPGVVGHLEEPVAGPGAVAQWLVAQRASEDVRILMSGCGGDELFGGYARAAAMRFDRPPAGLENYQPLFDRVRGIDDPARRAFALLDRRPGHLFAAEFVRAHPEPTDEFRDRFFAHGPAGAARAEIGIILPALLQVEDRVAMAFGVESRVPLLDRRLLRVAARLDDEGRVDADGRLKARLRDAATPFLPPAVAGRGDKMGFPLPLNDWFKGAWGDLAREVLLDRRTRERGMVDAAAVENALCGHARYDRALYSALVLELWCRFFLDG